MLNKIRTFVVNYKTILFTSFNFIYFFLKKNLFKKINDENLSYNDKNLS